jgi:uncharacterized protein
MAKNFAEIAFTESVKTLQTKYGSRGSYDRMEKLNVIDGLSDNEVRFIEDRDSFYMASIGTNEYPYIQHRGGPKGFLKVLDAKRLGFIDFKGNMQYISVGNVSTNNHVALILMDYAAKARLKIYANAEVVDLDEDPLLFSTLDLSDYKFRPERMMIFHIEAFDWNCPQHIIPRYSIEEIKEAFSAQYEYVAKLESEVAFLKSKLSTK